MSEAQKGPIGSVVESVKGVIDKIGEGQRRKQIEKGVQEVRTMVEGAVNLDAIPEIGGQKALEVDQYGKAISPYDVFYYDKGNAVKYSVPEDATVVTTRSLWKGEYSQEPSVITDTYVLHHGNKEVYWLGQPRYVSPDSFMSVARLFMEPETLKPRREIRGLTSPDQIAALAKIKATLEPAGK